MDREAFLQNIADQLKRPRQTKPPERDVIGVPSFYREHPFGETSAVDQLERFQEEWTALGGEVDVIDHTGQANDVLQHLFAELRPQTVVTWARRLSRLGARLAVGTEDRAFPDRDRRFYGESYNGRHWHHYRSVRHRQYGDHPFTHN